MPICEQNELFEKLLAELRAVTHRAIELAHECRFQRRPDSERGFVVTIAPTAEQQAVAAAIRRRFSMWQAAVSSVLTRRGVFDRSLDQRLETFAGLVELTYMSAMTIPAPRVRAAFEESVRTAAQELEDILRRHAPLFRAPDPCAAMLYDRFSVRIAPAGTRWSVEASYDGNRAVEVVDAPLAVAELQSLLAVRLDAARGSAREANPQHAEFLAYVGTRLFRSVFTGSVSTLYGRARVEALRCNRGIRLEFDVHDDHLSAIPWELVHDGLRFLGLARDVAIARRIAGRRAAHAETDAQPLRMLLTVSSPRDLTRIAPERERHAVEQAVAPLVLLGLLQLDVAHDGSVKTLNRMLTAARREGRPYQVWHLAAHGRYDAESRRGALAMTGTDGTAHWLGAVELASLFSDDAQLRLVVLSSCHGAEGNAHDSWSAAASAFLLCGVPAVVAQQLEISHAAGLALASELYGALVDGVAVEEAIAAGRRGIFNLPNYAEWVRPVLFIRSEEEASHASGE
jgi:hypothetical protein